MDFGGPEYTGSERDCQTREAVKSASLSKTEKRAGFLDIIIRQCNDGQVILFSDLSDFMKYNGFMAPKSLIKTNPFLKNPTKRKLLFFTTVASSTAIEGVHVTVAQTITKTKKPVKPVVPSESKASGGSRH